MRMLAGVVLLCLAGVAADVPRVESSSVRLSQAFTRRVDVRYVLEDAPAIVTFDLLTNGVSVGVSLLTNAVGDVNRVVAPGERFIHWNPWETWPNVTLTNVDIRAELTVWATNAPPDYLAIDLTKPQWPVTYYTCEDALPWGGVWLNETYKDQVILMRRIHAAGQTFMEGSPEDEDGRWTDGRETVRPVSLSQDYYLGIYMLTVAQYKRMVLEECEQIEDRLKPKYLLSYDALRGTPASGIDWPTTGHGQVGGLLAVWRSRCGGLELDLPTSAQWEFACRAGSVKGIPPGVNAVTGVYDDYNVTLDAQIGSGNIVGTKSSNAWRLFDMVGNGFEWCLDWEQESGRTSEAVLDPVGPEHVGSKGSYRVCRSGYKHATLGTRFCRPAFRTSNEARYFSTDLGVRLCVTLP